LEIDANQQSLESALAEVLACCSSEEEQQSFLQRLSPVKSELANIKRVIENKAVAHSMLADHVDACTKAQDKMAHIQNSLLDNNLSAGTVSELMIDLELTRDQLRQLEASEIEVKTRMDEAGLVCKDESTGEVVNIASRTYQLQSKIEENYVKLKICERLVDLKQRMQDADRDLSEVKHVYTDNLEMMNSAIGVSLFKCILYVYVCF